MTLSSKQRQYLKALAHPLKPLVQVGAKGIGDAVVRQIGEQLGAHELVKVRFNTECGVDPSEVAEDLAGQTRSELVQKKGRTLVLYRARPKQPTIVLPTAAGKGLTRAKSQRRPPKSV
jgi:RNA-binding protein